MNFSMPVEMHIVGIFCVSTASGVPDFRFAWTSRFFVRDLPVRFSFVFFVFILFPI